MARASNLHQFCFPLPFGSPQGMNRACALLCPQPRVSCVQEIYCFCSWSFHLANRTHAQQSLARRNENEIQLTLTSTITQPTGNNKQARQSAANPFVPYSARRDAFLLGLNMWLLSPKSSASCSSRQNTNPACTVSSPLPGSVPPLR